MTTKITSPIAGVVQEVLVQPGTHVQAGEPLALIAAMKMEFPIDAPSHGRIVAVTVQAGDTVQEGEVLFELAANP